MYHCHLQIYLIGLPCRAFELFHSTPPMERFTHHFMESTAPERELLSRADLILANLEGTEGASVARAILEGKRDSAQLVLLAEQGQLAALEGSLDRLTDLWPASMGEEEAGFRIHRWLERCKQEKDAWLTSQYLDAAINNIPSLIWFKDREGLHLKVNDSFCRTVNKSKDVVEGRDHCFIWGVGPEEEEVCARSDRAVMERKETCVAEEDVQSEDGMRSLTTYKSPLYDLDGSVMGTVGVGIDVTQERSYEQELIERNNTLEAIFTTLECGVLCHSADGKRILRVNDAALKILGYQSQEEMVGAGFDMVADSVIDEDKPKLRECIQSLKREGDSVGIEYRVLHKDGELLHVMGNVKLIRENGELCYQRFLLDWTEEKLQENERDRHQRALIQALSADFDLVCFTLSQDQEQAIALRVSGESKAELEKIFTQEFCYEDGIEQYIDKFVYGEDKDMLRKALSKEELRRELEDKKLYFLTYRKVLDGTPKYCEIEVVQGGRWHENHGVVLGFRNVDDETRKSMEHRQALEEALAQANRANKAKSTFLSNMSHDIRTPMNAIVGFTALSIAHIDNKAQVEGYLQKIMASSNHMISLINDVLDMSRIESGRMQLEEEPCSLSDLLHGLNTIIQGDVRDRGLKLSFDTMGVVNDGIYCDKLHFNQVLLNVLSNAVKYTKPGGSISLKVTEKPGAVEGKRSYEFRVKDTGIGMSKSFLAHIFEPFEREKNTTTSGIQGTGLGMAITKNIVDMMGGTIEVQSEQGVGTEVILLCPFRVNAEEMESQEIPELKGARALVVDADESTCKTVVQTLNEIGLQAEWTTSGQEAIELTRKAKQAGDGYQVYVIDWLLPDMNVIQVARELREETGGRKPVVVLTAYDWSAIEDEAREAGITAFCGKPLFVSELCSCLKAVVKEEERERGEPDAKARTYTGRILLVEDNELNQEIAQAILEDAGFSVELAENGQVAVEMLERAQADDYSLVLMDVQMPVMNGYEATRHIRALPDRKLAHIPILAMTANAFEEDKQEALRAGMDGHIAKPIDVETLFKKLDEILR